MLKSTLYYAAGGAVIMAGPALGYDLIRRGQLSSAEDLHHRESAAFRRVLQDDIQTQKVRTDAQVAGVDPDAVRRRFDQLREGAGTPALGDRHP